MLQSREWAEVPVRLLEKSVMPFLVKNPNLNLLVDPGIVLGVGSLVLLKDRLTTKEV